MTSPRHDGDGDGKRRRWRTILLRTAIALVALPFVLAIIVAGGLYWAGTETGLRFVLAKLEKPLADAGQTLRIESPTGSLWGELRVPRLSWRGAGTEVDGEDLLLRWTPRALFERRLQVAELSAGRLAVRLPPPAEASTPKTAPQMPGAIMLPGTVRVDRIAIGELSLTPGRNAPAPSGQEASGRETDQGASDPDQPTPIVVREIAAAAAYGDGRFTVGNLGATTPWGRLHSANAEFGDSVPHPLKVDASVEGEVERIGYALKLAAAGDLEKAAATLDGTAAGASVRIEAGLMPLATMPLNAARASIDGLDLSQLPIPAATAPEPDRGAPALPRTRLDIRADVAPRQADGVSAPEGWNGRLDIRNTDSGPLADDRLPLIAFETAFDWLQAEDPLAQRLRLEGLRLTLPGPAGPAQKDAPATTTDASIAGSVQVHPNRRLSLAGVEIPEVVADLDFDRIDVSRFAAQFPPTALAGSLDVDRSRFALALSQAAGPMRALLPASAAQAAEIVARGRIDDTAVTLDEARIRLGQSTITASGQAGAAAPHRLRLQGELRRIKLAQWLPRDLADDRRLRNGRVNADWSIDGTVLPGFDGAVAIRLADSALGGEPLTADIRTRARLDDDWQPRRLAQTALDVRLGQSRIRARGALGQPSDKLAVDAELPALARLDDRLAGRATISAELAGAFDRLRARASITADDIRLRQAGSQSPGSQSPGNQPPGSQPPGNQPDAELRITSLRIDASAPVTAAPPAQAPVSATIRLRGGTVAGRTIDALNVKADGTIGAHRFDIDAAAEDRRLALGGEGSASLQGPPSWRSTLATLTLDGPVQARLRGPAELRVDAGAVRVAHVDLAVAGGEAQLERLNLATGGTPAFEARGRIRDMPIVELLEIAGTDRSGLDPLDALRLDASWDLRGTGASDLSGEARIDLREPAGADPASGRAIGLRGDNGVDLRLADGRIDGRIDLSLPSLAFTHRLTAPDVVVDGRIELAGTIGGTLERPLYDIGLDAGQMAVVQRSMGWRLTDGSIAARFSGRTFELQRLRFASGDGSIELQGRARLLDAPRPGAGPPGGVAGAARPRGNDTAGKDGAGPGAGGRAGVRAGVRAGSRAGSRAGGRAADKAADQPSTLPLDGAFDLVATRFVVPIGPGQRLALSGTTRLTSDAAGLALRGKLGVDQGIIEIQGSTAPSLPSDVKLVDSDDDDGRPALDGKSAADEESAQAASAIRVLTDLAIDLGQQLRVTGRGAFARLTGDLRLQGLLPDQPRLTGLVNVVDGAYQAYGQNLKITRGGVRFNGPVDNPALDIRAARPFLPVEVGVEVTGTVLDPKIALFSTPEIAETDKLSWLVLGVDPKQAPSAAQSLALQQAARSLLVDDDGSYQPGIADRLGLDVLNFGYGSDTGMTDGVKETMGTATGLPGASTSANATDAQQEVVTLGKRIGSRLFVSYEQGVRGVWNLLRIQYALTRRLAVRAQSGSDTALDLLYSFSFD